MFQECKPGQIGLKDFCLEACEDMVVASGNLGLSTRQQDQLCHALAVNLSERAKGNANEEGGLGYPYKA